MIIGAHSRGNDTEVNPVKGKQLTNIRTTSKDEAVRLTPPLQMSLEEAIAYIEDDELVEVTPKAIRLRKRLLDTNDRKRASRARGRGVIESGDPLASQITQNRQNYSVHRRSAVLLERPGSGPSLLILESRQTTRDPTPNGVVQIAVVSQLD